MICSNREKFAPLWDVWIHILGIRAECACWGAGGPVCRPYGRNVVSLGGAPSRRALQRGWREPAPSSAPFGGTFPPGERHDGRVRAPAPTGIVGKNSGRTMCAPTGEGAGTGPLIRPSVRTGAPSPQGEGLGKTKRDRPGTCLLKHGGEAELRRKFFWFLFFQEKELLTFFFKESRQLGKVLYEMQENFAEISTFLTGGTVAKAGRLW